MSEPCDGDDRQGDDRRPRVLLGVTGGIAAYKAPEVVRALRGEGFDVQVVMTPAAEAFATPMALTTVSGRPVRVSVLDASEEGQVGHIELADWPDLVLIAPATADAIARAAMGMANDLLTTILLATQAPVGWAPAMNTNMWRHPATQANLATLAARGARFIGPDRGELACGWVGEGRMIDPPLIAAHARSIIGDHRAESWGGRRVLVSAGPTRAYLDPVRFLTNASTGVMGFALAEAAAQRGAEVAVVAGPVRVATPPGVRRIDIQTAPQMLAALDEELRTSTYDLVAMVAAVADLAPRQTSAGKLDKASLTRAMDADAWVEGVDILATLCERYRGASFFLGFGAQTVDDSQDIRQQLVRAGQSKLARKGCDAIFVNRVGVPDSGFSSATNHGVLLYRDRESFDDAGPPLAKHKLARWLLDRVDAVLRVHAP